MNEAINAALKQIEAARKPASAVPWEPDLPYAQNIYTFDYPTQQWKAAAGPNPARSQPDAQAASGPLISRLALFSWNIDFMLPHGRSRMLAALEELRTRVAALPAETAAVVFLQECVADDLDVIGAQAWVRAGFARTDVDTAAWASGLYGTTTLVDKRLDVRGVFRIHYALTRMERDALFVDVVFPSQHRAITEILEKRDDGKSGEKGKENEKIIRLCNTHLESLAQDPPYRPPQAALAARFMREESVWGALLAGDLNAIQPQDRTLHEVNGLQDAYLSLGGSEDSEDGYTWGQQAAPELRKLYGCSRMDKVWYCGGVSVTNFGRFGADVEVGEEAERAEIMRWGGFEKAWVTDHLGVFVEIDVVE